MKKIMFNDKYGLTKAVLNGRKTMTRRIIQVTPKEPRTAYGLEEEQGYVHLLDGYSVVAESLYKVGEVLAIAQSYKDLGFSGEEVDREPKTLKARGVLSKSAGWTNKMFVRAEACKHHIRITNVRVERLQAISDGDCLKEGIDYCNGYSDSYYFGHGVKVGTQWIKLGNSFCDAFASLIDRILGKGTWDGNPYVFVYDFELVK